MQSYWPIYLAIWLCLCLFAIYLAIRKRAEIGYFSPVYWRYLFQPWKVVTFVLALAAFNLAAPFSGDPTWDYVDSTFMSVLTYTTAPGNIDQVRAARPVLARIGQRRKSPC
jgi:hypothetical protein